MSSGLNQKKRIQALEAAAQQRLPGDMTGRLTSPSQINDLGQDGLLLMPALPEDDFPTSASLSQATTVFSVLEEPESHEPLHLQTEPSGIATPIASAAAPDTFNNNLTPLHVAIRNGNEAMVRLLIRHGANLARRDNDGSTSLHYAVKSGQEAIVKLVLGSDADIDGRNPQRCPLVLPDVVERDGISAAGTPSAPVDLNAKDVWGATALHLATERGSESLVLLLLAHGAAIDP